MDAVNTPVRRPTRELHSEDVKSGRKMQFESRDDLVGDVVVAEELHKDYMEALAFMEDPITIRIERSSEKFAPPTIPCWVNGKGAEVLVRGQWVSLGHLPVGVPLTTKRKYVEVLLGSKTDSIQTKTIKREDSEDNLVERFPSSTAPLSVLEDKSPRGVAWLTNIVRRA